MTMINCKKTKYQEALATCENQKGTKEERARLRHPDGGLFPHGLFRHTGEGRRIALSTWLMTLRADMRGKLAIRSLLKPEFEEHTNETGHTFKRRKRKPSAEAFTAALDAQHALIVKMLTECPEFFSGMIEDDVQEIRDEAAAE
jgi:hypothetical protein